MTNLRASYPVETKATIINTGATPAFIERQRADLFLRPLFQIDLSEEVRSVFDKATSGPPEYEIALPPGADGHVFINGHFDFRGDMYLCDGIKQPNDTIFLIGVVVYRDAQRRLHHSTCCYKWQPDGADLTRGKFVRHRRHNEMG